MKLIFLGTRGGIIARSKDHYMHASTMIVHGGKKIMIDCGTDWLHKVPDLKPDAILITHAHPDHVGGLVHGAPCKVYLSADSLKKIKKYPLESVVVQPRKEFQLFGLSITAIPVYHSVHAPAMGYRISSSTKTLFYVSDVAALKYPQASLKGCDVYIGDGAIITRRMLVRTKDHVLTGHAPIEEQLAWCRRYKVPKVIFTHCGSEIVKYPGEVTDRKVEMLATIYTGKVNIAHDGQEIAHF